MKKGSKAATIASEKMKALHKNSEFRKRWRIACRNGTIKFWKNARNRLEQAERIRAWHRDPINKANHRRRAAEKGIPNMISMIEEQLSNKNIKPAVRESLEDELIFMKKKLEMRYAKIEHEEKRVQNAKKRKNT